MIINQSLEMVVQRVGAGRGEYAGLPHPTTQPSAQGPSPRPRGMPNRPRGIRPAHPCPWTDRSTWCRKDARTSRPAGRSRRRHSRHAHRRSADRRSPSSSAPATTPEPQGGRRRLRRGSRSARRPRPVSPRSGIPPVATAAPPPQAEECPVAKRSSGSISHRAGRLPLPHTSRCARPRRRAAPPAFRGN